MVEEKSRGKVICFTTFLNDKNSIIEKVRNYNYSSVVIGANEPQFGSPPGIVGGKLAIITYPIRFDNYIILARVVVDAPP